MSATCSVHAAASSSTQAAGDALKVSLRLAAKSVDEAKQVVKGIQDLLSKYHEILEGGPVAISIQEDGPSVSCVVSAPAELMETTGYSGQFALVTSLVQCLTNIYVTWSFGSTFEEWMGSPGTPLHQLLGGVQFTLSSHGPSPSEGARGWLSSVPTFAMKLFSGCDVQCRLRYDQTQIADNVKTLGVAPEAEVTVDYLKLLVRSMVEEESDVATQLLLVRQLIGGLKAVESITVEGSHLLSAEHRTKMEVVVNFDHFNPFCLLEYILQPPAA